MKGIIAFILLAFGTLGLILNEFIVTMGTTAVVVFFLANIIGLVLFFPLINKKDESK